MENLERRDFWRRWGALDWARGPWVVDREVRSRLLATPLVIMAALSSAGIAMWIDNRLGLVDVWFGHSVAFTIVALAAFGMYQAWGRER